MKFLGYKAAAVAMGAGLTLGTMAGLAPSAGAALLPLLPTSTVVSSNGTASVRPTTVTATVSLELVQGLLVTPSGSVTFHNTNGQSSSVLGTAPLSSCLLGLPSLLGLTQATCSATIPIRNFCGLGTVTAVYSGATDLIAEPSTGSLAINGGNQC
jgi:hypothetical protein